MISSKYFSHEELSCNCGNCETRFSPITLQKLDALREAFGKPIILNSAYRCPEYNNQIGATQAHASGHAVDVKVSGKDCLELLRLAIKQGFTGFGLKQKGDYNGRFLHLDDLHQDAGRPRPHIWTY